MKKFQKIEAFTGLEAAIVLIAFVVVAAVFSYVVLGAGFFTTQKAQQVVYSGVQQASSNLVVVGEVYGNASGTTQADNNGAPRIHTLYFSLELAAGGTSIDMNKTVFTYQNRTILKTVFMSPTGCAFATTYEWCINSKSQTSDTDNSLERNEQFTIEVYLDGKANSVSRSAGGLPPSEDFTLQIRPEIGAALPLHKSAPGGITTMNVLY